MGHMTGKEVYRRLGRKIDSLTMRAPWNDALFDILSELYTTEEAELLINMSYGLSTLEKLVGISKSELPRLRSTLDDLCAKGLVIDIWINQEFHYMPSPMAVGIFENTMMRTGKGLDHRSWAALFHEYLHGDSAFYAANFGQGERISLVRALPYAEAIDDTSPVEVLDYEKATRIIEGSERFAIGVCSCRHEKTHLGEKMCDTPLETCSSFGLGADFLIRHEMAKEVSKSEMLENIARSEELGLVLSSDNVRQNIGFICQCCSCCCNLLLGISMHGYPNTVITSSFISTVQESDCTGCGKCARACPISAIQMMAVEGASASASTIAKVDVSICLGCGVCALRCHTGAARLIKRAQRVIHPETTFERVILQALERGTLQNQLFDNPHSVTQQVMRGIVGGFLRLPAIKRVLVSDALRSSFLASMKVGARMQGRSWLTEV